MMEGLPRGHRGLGEQDGILQRERERERQLREFNTSNTAVALLSALDCLSNRRQGVGRPAFISVLMCSSLCSSLCLCYLFFHLFMVSSLFISRCSCDHLCAHLCVHGFISVSMCSSLCSCVHL